MENKKTDSGWSALSISALLIAPLICCGGPLLIGVLGATGVGAVVAGAAKAWILGGVLLVVAIVVTVMMFRRKAHQGADCCAPKVTKQNSHMDCCSPGMMSHMEGHQAPKQK